MVFPISNVPPQMPPQVAAELPLTVLFVMVRAGGTKLLSEAIPPP
jgi:hypothetical protein